MFFFWVHRYHLELNYSIVHTTEDILPYKVTNLFFFFLFSSGSKRSRAEGKHAPRLRIESSAIFDSKKGEHVMSVKFSEGVEVTSTVTFTLTNICASAVFEFKDWIGPYISDEICFPMPDEQDIRLRPSKKRFGA